MSTSVFIARLIGPVMLVIGLAVFANQRAFREPGRGIPGEPGADLFSLA